MPTPIDAELQQWLEALFDHASRCSIWKCPTCDSAAAVRAYLTNRLFRVSLYPEHTQARKRPF